MEEFEKKLDIITGVRTIDELGALLYDVREIENVLRTYEKILRERIIQDYDKLVGIQYLKPGDSVIGDKSRVWIREKEEKTVSYQFFKTATEEVPQAVSELYRKGIVEVKGKEKAAKFISSVYDVLPGVKGLQPTTTARKYKSVYAKRLDEEHSKKMQEILDKNIIRI